MESSKIETNKIKSVDVKRYMQRFIKLRELIADRATKMDRINATNGTANYAACMHSRLNKAEEEAAYA